MHTCIASVLPRESELFYVFIFIRANWYYVCASVWKGDGLKWGGGQKSFFVFNIFFFCSVHLWKRAPVKRNGFIVKVIPTLFLRPFLSAVYVLFFRYFTLVLASVFRADIKNPLPLL